MEKKPRDILPDEIFVPKDLLFSSLNGILEASFIIHKHFLF
jgi:hypothetical protein